MNREKIVNAAVDIYGYGYDDFDGMNLKEVLNYLDFEQCETIKEFYGFPRLHYTKVEAV